MQDFKYAEELLPELMRIADDFVSNAIKFGCSLTRRRKANTLQPRDVSLYVERTFHLRVPGFSSEAKPYRRPVVSEEHRLRTVAVRNSMRAEASAEHAAATAAQLRLKDVADDDA